MDDKYSNRTLIIPAQIRAGRALVDWSQAELAERSGLGLSTIKSFEGGRPSRELLASRPMREALERAGVVFVAGNANEGPGVRFAGERPNIIRRPTGNDFYERVGFIVEWRGAEICVYLPKYVLDDLHGPILKTAEQVVESFDKHLHLILQAIITASADSARFRPSGGRGVLQLQPDDFPALR